MLVSLTDYRRMPDRSVPAPSTEVTRVEDLFQKSNSSGGPLDMGRLQLDEKFPRRPGYGTRGQKVVLWTNYFELIPPPDLVLYRYNIGVQPAVVGKKLLQVIKLLLEIPPYKECRDDIVTDFKSTLISRRRLHSGIAEYAIQYKAEGEDEPKEKAPTYKVKVEETGTLTVSQLTEYLTATSLNSTYADKLPVLQALNIFLGHYAKASPMISTLGSSKAFSLSSGTPKWDLGAGLTALRGFFSSVRVATCRILVNVNVSHAAFYDAIPLDQLMRKYGSAHRFSEIKLEGFLKKVRIRSTHLKEKQNKAGQTIPRVKTIFSLARTDDGHGSENPPRVQRFGARAKEVQFFLRDSSAATPSSTTQASGKGGGKKKGKGKKSGPSDSGPGEVASSGRYISVYDFFKTSMYFLASQIYTLLIVGTAYGHTANPDIPVVNVGNRENPSYLPADVCVVMPGQNSGAKLDPNQTQNMITFAVRKPWENANSIVQQGPNTVGLLPQANVSMVRSQTHLRRGRQLINAY